MSKKAKILLVLAGVLVVIAVAGMSINYGTGLVRDMVTEAVAENMDSEISIDSVSGNPFRGYRISGVALSTDGEEVLVADRITAKVSVMSFLTGGPPVSLLEIVGFRSDVDSINRLIPKIQPGEDEGELPLEKVRIVDSSFESEWAKVDIRSILLTLAERDIGADLDVMVDELPVKGAINVSHADGAWSIAAMNVNIGKGNLAARGDLTPELSVEGSLSELDIPSVIAFWPETDPALYRGAVSTEFSAQGPWEMPDISGDLDYTGELLAGVPVEKATARWRFRSNRLDVADLDMRLLGFPLSGNLAFVFDPAAPPRMQAKLQGAAADLEALAKVSEKLEGMSGTLDEFTVSLQGPVSNPEGRIAFEAEKLGYMGYTVTDTSIDASVKRGNIAVSGKSVFEGAPVALGGNVSNFMTQPEANLSGTLRSLSLQAVGKLVPALDEMKASGSVNADYKVTGRVPDLAVSGKVWSERLSAMDYDVTGVSSFFDYDVRADTLSFTDMKAGWKGAAISGKGMISNVSSEERTGDIQVRAGDLDSAFLAGFHPPVADYKLEGKIAVEADVKGKLSDPSATVSLTSPSLTAMETYRLRNFRAGTKLAGLSAGAPSELDLDMTADSVDFAGVSLRNVKLGVGMKENVITVTEGNASLGAGNLSATGTATLAEPTEKSALDITVKAENVDLQRLVMEGGKALPMAGVVSGNVKVAGTVENPEIAVDASAPFVAASGVKVDNVKVKLSGNMDKITLEDVSGEVGEGNIAVTGGVRPVPFAADVAVNGKNLDLQPMVSRFEKLKPYNITGAMDLVFNGHFEEEKNSGTGEATSSSVRFMGMNFTDIVLPIELVDNRLVSSNGTAKLYGGQISNKGSLNLTDMSFNDEAEVNGTNVEALLKDAFDLKGNISTTADLFTKISGSFGDDGVAYDGRGLLKTGQGSITGFKIIDIVTAVHGVKGLRFDSAYAPFLLETGSLILGEDTLVKAPEGDPLYRHFKASGPVGPENRVALDCSGNVNMKVINAFLGGAAGGIAGLTATQNVVGILEGALTGAGSRMEADDFRDVSFTLKGTFDKPGVSNVKISSPEKQEGEEVPATEDKTPVEQLQEKAIQQVMPSQKDAPEAEEAKPSSPLDQLKENVLQQVIPGKEQAPETKPQEQVTVREDPAAPDEAPLETTETAVAPDAADEEEAAEVKEEEPSKQPAEEPEEEPKEEPEEPVEEPKEDLQEEVKEEPVEEETAEEEGEESIEEQVKKKLRQILE